MGVRISVDYSPRFSTADMRVRTGGVLMKNLLVLLLFASSPLFAQGRFDGTWEMKMDSLEFSGTPEEYLPNEGMFHCLSCVPKVDVRTDGSDHKVTGRPNADTMSVRVVDPSSVEFIFKKEGKPTFACIETVSPDGNTMTEEFTETPISQRVTGHATFTRVSKGPVVSHALSGSWQMRTVRNVSSTGPTTTYQTTKDGLNVSAGPQHFEAKFDGKDYPVQGDPSQMVSLRRIGDDTIEETERQDGKVLRVTLITVSRDGKSMRVESADKLRGGSMTYTAEKRR
jgi:hypothetical protein